MIRLIAPVCGESRSMNRPDTMTHEMKCGRYRAVWMARCRRRRSISLMRIDTVIGTIMLAASFIVAMKNVFQTTPQKFGYLST